MVVGALAKRAEVNGKVLLWSWALQRELQAKCGGSRWFNAHNQVLYLNLDKGFELKGDGFILTVIGYCWDNEFAGRPAAAAELQAEGFRPWPMGGSGDSDTTEPESDDEDLLGGNRERGCPLFRSPGIQT